MMDSLSELKLLNNSTPLRVAAVDPGLETGWVKGVLLPPNLQDKRHMFNRLDIGITGSTKCDYDVGKLAGLEFGFAVYDLVVVEQPPIHGNSQDLLKLFSQLCGAASNLSFAKVVKVLPGVWKPMRHIVEAEQTRVGVVPVSRHAKDALHMLGYALRAGGFL